jgi:Ca2+-binding EF-hand superfamily protein
LENCLKKLGFTNNLSFTQVAQVIVEYNNDMAHEIFVSSVPEGHVGLPVSKLVLAFYQSGSYLNRTIIAALLTELGAVESEENQDQEIDEDTFKNLMALHQQKKILLWRQTCGFSVQDVEHFRSVCQKFNQDDREEDAAKDHEGALAEDGIDLDKIQEILAALKHVPKEDGDRQSLTRKLMRVDRQKSGRITFEELLLLMRHLHNCELQSRTQEESKIVAAVGLQNSVVGQFRKAFQDKAQVSESCLGVVTLSRAEIKDLFSKLGLVVTAKQKNSLPEALQEVYARAGSERRKSHSDLSNCSSSAEADDARFTFAQFMLVLGALKEEGILSPHKQEGIFK